MAFQLLSVLLAQAYVTTPAALRPEDVFQLVAPRTFVLMVGDNTGSEVSVGSAVVVGPRTLVTNAHVVGSATNAVLKQGERVLLGAVLRLDRERDLALIRVEVPRGEAPRIRPFRTLKVGERVFAIGTPRLMESTFSDGLIAALRASAKYPIQTSAPVSEGSSGGGLFDSSGSLVGVITAINKSGQNLNFAVPADWVAELLALEAPPQDQAQVSAPQDAGPARVVEVAGGDSMDDEGTPGVATPNPKRKKSKSGWETLRWGMSPKEVARLMTASSGPFRLVHECELEVRKYSKDWRVKFPKMIDYRASCAISAEEHQYRINGVAPDIWLYFDSDGLESVGLRLDASGATIEEVFSAQLATYSRIRDATDAIFGAATVAEPPDLQTHRSSAFLFSGLRVWERDETKVKLTIGGGTASEVYMTVDYGYCPECARARIPAKSWAKGGWQNFRWRMGPGDVEAVVGTGFRLKADGFAQDSMFGEGRKYVATLPTPLYGATLDATFVFGGDRLYWILLVPTVQGGPDRCDDWERNVKLGLKQKYGVLVRESGSSLLLFDQPTEVMLARDLVPRESKSAKRPPDVEPDALLGAPQVGEGASSTPRCNIKLLFKDGAVSRWQDAQFEREIAKEADESL